MNRLTVALTCDHNRCREEFTAGSVSLTKTRKAAREAGWRYVNDLNMGFLDLCPQHSQRQTS